MRLAALGEIELDACVITVAKSSERRPIYWVGERQVPL
jgi:hypothetical protein